MMMDFYTAFFLGLTFSNIWICALVIFSLQTSDKRTGIGYIAGRFAGIVGLVLIFHIMGENIRISSVVIDAFSGLTILIFGFYFIFKYKNLYDKGKNSVSHRDLSEKCEHNCNSCIISKKPDIYKYCESCTDDKESCFSENIQIEPLTREARRLWGKSSDKTDAGGGFLAGVMLGILRGSAMCGRLAALIPFALKGSLTNSFLVGTGFALSSSIYPVFAMIFGNQILKLVKYRNAIIYANSVLLIIVAFYYLLHAAIKMG